MRKVVNAVGLCGKYSVICGRQFGTVAEI